jgi:Negative regulator of sigma F
VTQPTSCLGLSALDRRPARTGIALMGHEWLECLVSIPIIAVVPFTVIICAVRRAAPDQSGSNRRVQRRCRRRGERDRSITHFIVIVWTIHFPSSHSGMAARSCFAYWQARRPGWAESRTRDSWLLNLHSHSAIVTASRTHNTWSICLGAHTF